MSSIIHLIQAAPIPFRIAVTGGRHVGKTTGLMQIYQACVNHQLDAGGFIEKAVFEDNTRIGYDFVDLVTGEICPVARKKETGGYTFFDDAWLWAETKMQLYRHSAILFVDELGRLEATNHGIMPSLCRSLKDYPRHLIASVRDDAMDAVESLLGTWDAIIRV